MTTQHGYQAPFAFEPLRADDPAEVGGYRLHARLGSGGMGSVYLSFTPGGRAVAIKIVRREYADDPEFRARFAREVRAAQLVNGLYTAQVLDAGPEAPTPWLATAYVAGPTLAEAVRTSGPLPAGTCRLLLAAIAESLQAIHAAGIVHRDLKPLNVVLAADGPRVIDFGIARAADATPLTGSGMRVGSPLYMAPEQALGKSAAPATDVFALGALAYYAATGRPAFGEGNGVGILYRIINEEPDLTDCPPGLAALVRSCLAKDPGQRPTTVAVIEACRAAGTEPRIMPGWLPEPVSTLIQTRAAAIAALAANAAPPGQTTVAAPPPLPGPLLPPPVQAAPAFEPPGRVAGPGRSRGPVLAAVLALAGAVVYAAVKFSGGGSIPPGPSQSSRTANVGGVAATTGAPADNSPARSGPPSTAPASSAVQWSGDVRLSSEGIELDTVPPQIGGTPTDLLYTTLESLSVYSFAPYLEKWTGTGMPTRSDCATAVSTQGIGQLTPSVGDVICVRTTQGRYAVLTVTVIDFNSASLTAHATVWAAVQTSPTS